LHLLWEPYACTTSLLKGKWKVYLAFHGLKNSHSVLLSWYLEKAGMRGHLILSL
jgi:hypothetical protein